MSFDKILLIFLYNFNSQPFPSDKYLVNCTQIALGEACKVSDTAVRFCLKWKIYRNCIWTAQHQILSAVELCHARARARARTHARTHTQAHSCQFASDWRRFVWTSDYTNIQVFQGRFSLFCLKHRKRLFSDIITSDHIAVWGVPWLSWLYRHLLCYVGTNNSGTAYCKVGGNVVPHNVLHLWQWALSSLGFDFIDKMRQRLLSESGNRNIGRCWGLRERAAPAD